MAVERFVSPVATPEDDHISAALRPRSMTEYVGQPELLERLSITITAARQRSDAMEHVLLHGPPGLGKTTMAHVIANEMGARLHTTSGPALTRGTDLVSVLSRLEANDVLFIDEIHRLPISVEEFIYPAMEDFSIDVPVDSGLSARTVTIALKPFTLIGATTRAGLVSAPLRSRFGITHHLRYYNHDELFTILDRSSRLLNVQAESPDSLSTIATRSRGTPRIANRLLRRARDYAQVKNNSLMCPRTVTDALALEGIDNLGLDVLDHAYLRTLATTYKGGPAGIEAIAASMNEDSGTLEDVVEPYLLQLGFVARTRRGRELTDHGRDHLANRTPTTFTRTNTHTDTLYA